MDTTLLYFSSDHIVDFIRRHPINWKGRENTLIGTIGNVRTPTLGVQEFLTLLGERKALFTANEYIEHCLRAWDGLIQPLDRAKWSICGVAYKWVTPTIEETISALARRCETNFYVSCIDTLHFWALLCENGAERCVINLTDDSSGSVDVTVWMGDKAIPIALIGPKARDERDYKVAHRKARTDTLVIQLTYDRPMGDGNKRWYGINDLVKARLITPEWVVSSTAKRAPVYHKDETPQSNLFGPLMP